jgi:hypothetical protein
MSTKTTFKRVALVAVASLGFGVLTSVAPASATQATVAEVTAVTIATPANGRISSALASAVGFTSAGTLADGSEVNLAGAFVSKPAGSLATIIFDNTGMDITGPTTDVAAFTAAAGFQPSKLVVDSTGAAYTNGTHVAGRVGFVPDVAGDYVIKVWHDADLDGAIGATEAVSSSTTFSVGAAPATLTLTKYGSTTIAGGTNGVVVKIALPAGTGLALGEAIRVTPSTTTADITKVNGTGVNSAAGAAYDLTSVNFIAGVAWINVTDAAGDLTLTFTGQGASIVALYASTTVAYKTVGTGDTGTTVIQGATAGAAFTTITDGINGDSTTSTIPLAAKTLTYFSSMTAGAAAADYFAATVTDSSGHVTGSAAYFATDLVYDVAYLGAANATTATTIQGSFTVAISPTATGNGFNVTTANGTALLSGVTTAAVATSSGTVTTSPAGATPLKVGGTITYTVTAKDQFGRALPNAIVTMTTNGRNSNQTVIAKQANTDALGVVTFTITDAPLATTTSLLDTWTFTVRGADNTTKSPTTAPTINWSVTGPVVGTVTILGGNNATTTGVADDAPTYKDIAAGTSGATGSLHTAVATVKDASGSPIIGVPVTFTVTGTTAAVTTSTQTMYTGATGTASANVYAWAAGSYTVTATSGGVAATAVYQFRQSAAGEERAISATVSGNIVTAKVVDRFGNGVPSVTVYATKTGVGYFGSGNLKTSNTTDANGEVSFLVAGGDADVTVATYDIATAVAPLGSGQTCARAGASTCALLAADETLFTASVAGTTLVAEKGVGASFSAAGVSSAKVTVAGDNSAQAAADAAAEATDAANAATDAANAAAEAADAATAAAQDAADAVAALSTQVSEMVNALKKQITALTNLVIKIQKKVKA